MAVSTGAQQPVIAANIVKREGDWVYLDEESAKRHPLYGIRGWAALLASVLVAGALLGLFVTVGAVVGVVFGAIEGAIVAVSMAGASAYQLFVAARLWKMQASFQRHYLILFVISLAVALVSFVMDPEEGMQSIVEIVIMGLWLAYVLQSVRINVTTQKRVSAGDALVREAIVDMDPRRPKSAQY